MIVITNGEWFDHLAASPLQDHGECLDGIHLRGCTTDAVFKSENGATPGVSRELGPIDAADLVLYGARAKATGKKQE